MWTTGLTKIVRASYGNRFEPVLIIVRGGHRIRGKPPSEARNLQQRLEELRQLDIKGAPPTDIGFPYTKPSRINELSVRLKHYRKQRNDPELEKSSRNHELRLDLELVNKEWQRYNAPHHIKRVSEHFGIFKDLYEEGYFFPRVYLNIKYNTDDGIESSVYYGNVIKPTEARNVPDVNFVAEEDSLWTLMLTNLDGHLTENRKEYLHWCVTNIPGNDIGKGEQVIEYLQPIPPRGTGYHRYVFILYKQIKKCDFNIKKVNSKDSLADRTFVTRDWYSDHQDVVTPAGLAFFQTNWDSNITTVYHNVLGIKEPVYEYDFPAPFMRPQVWFPLRKAFDTYLDRYKDPRDKNRDMFLNILKNEHPFKKPKPPLDYPNAVPFSRSCPSWYVTKTKKERLRQGRINDVLI